MPGMDRRELDAIMVRLIAAAGDADAIAATVPPSQVGPMLRRLRSAGMTLGGTMRAIEARQNLSAGQGLGGYSLFCGVCYEPFRARRSGARYCSTRCRVAAHRARVTAVTARG